LLGAGIAVFINFKNSPDSGENVLSEWQKPSLHIYQCFAGSKGPVVWEIYRQDKMRLDSCKYDLTIMDPEKNTIVAEKPVLKPMAWKELFNFTKKFDGQFFQIGDIAYACSEEYGLTGYNIYDFSVEEDATTLGKKYPELSSGISKAAYMWYKKGFQLTTNKGEEFVWFPEANLLRTKEEDDNAFNSDTITETKIYLNDDGTKIKLYLARWRQDKFRDEMEIGDHILKDYEKNKNYYKQSYHIDFIQPLTDRIFFQAKPLVRTNKSVVLVYTDDLSQKAKVHIESIDNLGKSLWKNSDAILEELKSNSTNALSFEHRHSANMLVISTYGAERKSFGIDLKNGKLMWTYSPEKKP
jgi:hypothetical protein